MKSLTTKVKLTIFGSKSANIFKNLIQTPNMLTQWEQVINDNCEKLLIITTIIKNIY